MIFAVSPEQVNFYIDPLTRNGRQSRPSTTATGQWRKDLSGSSTLLAVGGAALGGGALRRNVVGLVGDVDR